MKVTFENRPCEIELDNVVYDHDYWCDAYASGGYWLDTEKDFTEDELDRATEYMQSVHNGEDWIMKWLY